MNETMDIEKSNNLETMPKSKTKEIPYDSPTPHDALYQVIEWLGVGFETTLTQRSDRSKLRIRIETEERAKEKDRELKMLKSTAKEVLELARNGRYSAEEVILLIERYNITPDQEKI